MGNPQNDDHHDDCQGKMALSRDTIVVGPTTSERLAVICRVTTAQARNGSSMRREISDMPGINCSVHSKKAVSNGYRLYTVPRVSIL
jgi:hypothetical protein